MDKNLLKFVEELKKKLGGSLKAFVVYGSAATGEFYKYSDFNTLLVLDDSGLGHLKAMSGIIKKWVSKGQPVPLIFTEKSLLQSSDVFPLEFFDIKENSVLLHGADLFKKIKINPRNLRLEIERELKSKLIRLRQAYVASGGDPKKVKVLMIRSISSFLAILKGIIRLNGKKAPAKKADIIKNSPANLKLNARIFSDILSIKDSTKTIRDNEVDALFGEYLAEISRIADLIDKR